MTANPRNNERIIVIALTAAFCCSGLFLSAPAAQELDRLQPASSQREGYIGVESGQSALDGQYEAGVFTNFVSHPLLGYVDGEASFVIIDSLLIAHVHGAYAPVDFLRFSLDLPTYIFQTGDNEVAVGRPAGSLDGAGTFVSQPKARFMTVEPHRSRRTTGHQPSARTASRWLSSRLPLSRPARPRPFRARVFESSHRSPSIGFWITEWEWHSTSAT